MVGAYFPSLAINLSSFLFTPPPPPNRSLNRCNPAVQWKMALPFMELFIQPQPLHVSSYVQSWSCLRMLVQYSDYQAIPLKFYCQNPGLKCLRARSAASCSGTRLRLLGVFPLAVMTAESSNAMMSSESKTNLNTHHNEDQYEARRLSCHHSEPAVACTMEEIKEFERRRRIGLANKGRVPWNKGKRHRPETVARISERTREALRDPKVKRKLSEVTRMHSEQSKEKISSSLRQLWAKRLKLKRSTEKFYSSWTESIAEAARRGGINEEELRWDSYHALKEEIALLQLQRAAEKTKKKEMKKIQAEKRVQEKAEKMASQVRKKMNLKQEAVPTSKRRGRPRGRARDKNEKQSASSEFDNSKARLRNTNGRKVRDGTFCNQAGVMLYLQTALERLDIESIKKEQWRSTVSLADQIQAAKRKRTQATANGSTIRTSLGS